MREHWKVDVPEGRSGPWVVERFTVSDTDSQWSFITGRGRGVPAGDYTKLKRDGSFDVTMSDTPDEYSDHREAIRMASGHVLLNGLGLGCVLQCMAEKPEVTKITVIERSEDVIALVAPHYQAKYGDKIEIIQADALEYKPPKGVRYGVVWHDIWDNMCEDNLPQMHTLHRKYGRRADWQGSWGRSLIEYRKRQTKDAFWRR